MSLWYSVLQLPFISQLNYLDNENMSLYDESCFVYIFACCVGTPAWVISGELYVITLS